MKQIKLSEAEIMYAAGVGVARQVENLEIGRIPAYGAGNMNNWQIHLEGALGEMALAKYLKIE